MKPIPTLIADDSAMIVKIIKKALLANKEDGFHFEEESIFTAADGMEAFEMIAAHPCIELIISDINMPHLNGDEFVEILQDTNKINDMDILFVTATATKMMLKPNIKEIILGVIYKPFSIELFNEKMHQLYIDKNERNAEIQKLCMLHLKQKMKIKKICATYLEHFKIKFDAKILNAQIGDHFHNEHVKESEYNEIVHSSLSLYMFETNTTHKIDNKRINCIINNFDNTIIYKENRFGFIKGFKTMLSIVKEDEDLHGQDLIEQLTTPLLDNVALAYATVKKFPKQDPKRFSRHFKYVIKTLIDIDCEFFDAKLQKLIIDLNETAEFGKWLANFITTNGLSMIPNVKKSLATNQEVVKRLKQIHARNTRLRHHICGEIDSYIWQRAKNSKEIVSYFKKHMPKRIPNSLELLLYKEKIPPSEYRRDYKLDKQKVIVISNELNTLELFKSLTDTPFDNWQFFAFSKKNVLDAWLKTNEPSMIVVDYSYKTDIIKSGMQLVRIVGKTHPIFTQLTKKHKLFLIVTSEDVVELQKKKNAVAFNIIDAKLSTSSISKSLIYK